MALGLVMSFVQLNSKHIDIIQFHNVFNITWKTMNEFSFEVLLWVSFKHVDLIVQAQQVHLAFLKKYCFLNVICWTLENLWYAQTWKFTQFVRLSWKYYLLAIYEYFSILWNLQTLMSCKWLEIIIRLNGDFSHFNFSYFQE